jgi:sarcosine oxidase subunit gamma
MANQVIQLSRLSSTQKFGVKGANAASWLEECGLPVPASVYDSLPTQSGGRIIRAGTTEFFIELPADDASIGRLSAGVSTPAVYLFPRSDQTILLGGPGALNVFAQTCGVDFRTCPSNKAVYSRVAGVSCAIVPISEQADDFRLYVDHTYVDYLWDTLSEIVADLGGTIVGDTMTDRASNHSSNASSYNGQAHKFSAPQGAA